MNPIPTPFPPSRPDRTERMFPSLSSSQMGRVATYGRLRDVAGGERLVEAGTESAPFFVVERGEIQILRPSGSLETVIATLGPGGFTGEANMLSGRRSLARSFVSKPGRVIELSREQLLALVRTDAELGELLMRAFILRRVELIAGGIGDVVLIGSSHSAATLRLREFLTRNGHPYSYVELERAPEIQEVLDRLGVTPADVPVLITRGEIVLRNPTNAQVAESLGFNAEIDRAHTRDLVVIGAGPSGLAAAVYAASEGLDVLVIESNSPGGQAGSSSRIENYLGFPTGIPGQELAGRAYAQAQKFGAQVLIAKSATGILCSRRPYTVRLDDGVDVPARTIVIATGAEYRKLPLENLARFENSGVYYAATFLEAPLCQGQHVVVVGGGNSAGQAAIFLADCATRVHMIVRGDGLAESMSRYLIQRIEENPLIELRTKTEVVGLEGGDQLEFVRLRSVTTGAEETLEARHVFVMTGAVPNTRWADGCVAVDANGFIKTGPDLTRDDLADAAWPLRRAPHLLETSRPGVFSVGDVRGGSIKRVASAVGEGAIAVALVHRVINE